MTEQERFEANIKGRFICANFTKVKDEPTQDWYGAKRTDYIDLEVQSLWTTWQAALPSEYVAVPVDVDQLSNFIRQVDGNHSMGAGVLAEHIADWLKNAGPLQQKEGFVLVPVESAKFCAEKTVLYLLDANDGYVGKGSSEYKEFEKHTQAVMDAVVEQEQS